MLSFLHRAGLWWLLCGLFCVLFVIGSFPRFNIEAVPWIGFAAICAGIAVSPSGSLRRLWRLCVQVGWEDRGMRNHLFVALTLMVLGFVSMGFTGWIPVFFTTFAFHPVDFWAHLKVINETSSTGGLWPYFLLSSWLWPWAFPAAHAVLIYTPIRGASKIIRGAVYVGIVLVFWITQSVVLSYLTKGTHFLFRRV